MRGKKVKRLRRLFFQFMQGRRYYPFEWRRFKRASKVNVKGEVV